MNPEIYFKDSEIEDSHWWFVVRRKLVKKYLKNIAKNSLILDVGSSVGSNLRMLKESGFNNYLGIDVSNLAQEFCHKKNLGEVLIADICQTNFTDNYFDAIIATDVLEHIKNDELAISEMKRILKPDGVLIITVPCFQSLWSNHDYLVMHQRRYRLSEISKKITDQNLKIEESYYFNFLLFLPILVFRKVKNLLMKFDSIDKKFNIQNSQDTSFVNKKLDWLLKIIFLIDIKISPIIKPFFGVSAFILVKKTN
jgi:SAM-dependent methyltransferase